MKAACVLLITLLAVAIPAAHAGWAADPDYIARQSLPFFKDKSPEQIAPYLCHHNGLPYQAAVLALAAHGERALPLIEELMADTHPWIRAGALDTLGEIHKHEGKEERVLTPQLSKAVGLAARLLDDPHPAVQEALGGFVGKLRVETPQTRKMVLKMAASSDPGVRHRALNMGRHWLEHPETVVRIGMLVSAAPKGNTPGHWNLAHLLVQRYKDEPVSRKAIPTMAAVLRHKANTRPYRGFFSDGAQFRAMEVMDSHWSKEVEAIPDVVPGLCRSYVRVPYHKYPGWIKTRELAWKLLGRCTRASVPAIRATIAEEKKWLADVSDLLLQTTTETKPEDARTRAKELLARLEKLATGLQAR